MATRNAIEPWLSVPKQPTIDAAHHTTAHPNCIFHFKMMLEVAFAPPSMAPIIAMNTCASYRPLNPSDIRTRNKEMPIPIHTAPITSPIVDSGFLCPLREETTPESKDEDR